MDECLKLIKPISKQLREIPVEAMARYERSFRRELPLNRGQASDLHELSIQIVRERLGGIRSFRIIEPPAFPRVLLYWRNRVVFQFKKIGRSMCPVNYPTEAAKAFDQQTDIEGLPACPRITVGPLLSQDGTQLLGSMLVCMASIKKPAWYYDLLTGQGTEVLQFPNLGLPDEAPDANESSEGDDADIA